MFASQTKIGPALAPSRAHVMLACILAGAAMLTGCAAPLTRRPPTEPVVEGEAGSWAMVFPSSRVALAMVDVDPRGLPEYSRNDRALNVRTFGPLTASTQWPDPQRPSLAFPRRVYLNPRADTILFFENEPRGYRSSRSDYDTGGYWGYGGR